MFGVSGVKGSGLSGSGFESEGLELRGAQHGYYVGTWWPKDPRILLHHVCTGTRHCNKR